MILISRISCFFPPVFLRPINTFVYSHEIIRLLIKELCPPNIKLVIDNIFGSEPSLRVMAVAVAVLGPEAMTFILCFNISGHCLLQSPHLRPLDLLLPAENTLTQCLRFLMRRRKQTGKVPGYVSLFTAFLLLVLFTGSSAKEKWDRYLRNSESRAGVSSDL